MLKRSGRNARSWHESDSVRRRDRSRPIEGGEKGARRGKDEKRGVWHRMVGNEREREREERAREKPAKRQRAEKIRYGAIETQEDIAAEERRGPRNEAEGRGGGGGGGGESGGGRKRHA